MADTLVNAAKNLTNLNVIVIAAGLSGKALQDLTTLTQRCLNKVLVRIVSVSTASDVDIRKAFAEAMEHIRALLVRQKDGTVKVLQVRTRNIEAVNKMDAMASQALQRYDTVKTIDASNSNEMRGLMALMGSTKI